MCNWWVIEFDNLKVILILVYGVGVGVELDFM